MATTQTALRMMRAMCLSLPATVEAEHFGEACFRVGKRLFASCSETDAVCRLVSQRVPGHANQLVASGPRFAPYARQKNCVCMDAASVENWAEVRALVVESYRLNAPADSGAKQTSATARQKQRKDDGAGPGRKARPSRKRA